MLPAAASAKTEPYTSLSSFRDLGAPDVLLDFGKGQTLPVHSKVIQVYSKVLRSALDSTKMLEQSECFTIPVVEDNVQHWRQALVVLYHVLGGRSRDRMWASVAQVSAGALSAGPSVPGKRKKHIPVSGPPTEDAVSVEQLADKYDMPTLAYVALEELQRKLLSKTSAAAKMDVWKIAGRAVHWANTEVLDTCMEVVAQPLERRQQIVIPAVTTPLCVHSQGVLRAFAKAVNKAVTKGHGPVQFSWASAHAAEMHGVEDEELE